jgi:hypothetical protein
MTFLDAAYEILKQAGAPLHYADIASRALAAGLLRPPCFISSNSSARPATRQPRWCLAGGQCQTNDA